MVLCLDYQPVSKSDQWVGDQLVGCLVIWLVGLSYRFVVELIDWQIDQD